MIRIAGILVILASFNVLAMMLFMSGQASPYLVMFAPQEVYWVTIGFIVLMDIFIIKSVLLSGGARYYGDFEKVFRKHYDGSNYEQAMAKAMREFKK